MADGNDPLFESSAEQAHPDLRLHSVHVFVRDQERSIGFYLDKLGFELVFEARLQSGERWVGVSPPNGTAVLTLIQPKKDSPECKFIGRATRAVFVTEDVAATFREWSNRGVRFRHPPRLRRVNYKQLGTENETSAHAPVWGEVFTRFEDIDRNSFTLVSFDAVSAAIEAQRRALAEKLEAERRLAYELDIARQVQRKLFPQDSPECSSLEYAGLCAPARHVGGDYYDFLSLGEDRVGLIIGDVAGKGIAAALLMANLQAHLRSQCAVRPGDHEALLACVNRMFFDTTTSSSYATLFFAEYTAADCRLKYVNCGHVPGLIIRHDRSIERLVPTATVLGLFKDWECAVSECALHHGDILALYTDGVTESFDAAGDEFGEDRLVDSLRRHAALCPVEMAQAVLREVQSFASKDQHDDITLMLAKRRPNE